METMEWLYGTETRPLALARWRGKQIVPIEEANRDTGRGCKLNRKIVANIFQKPLDKLIKVWYNIYTDKRNEVVQMTKAIWFDMDGTIANLYGDPDWLRKLRAYDPTPYANALPLVNMSLLARYLNRLQKQGYQICIVSWLSKEPNPLYDALVTQAKLAWLKKHLASVQFDRIDIIAYGTPKGEGREGILFDDELRNREQWGEGAYDVDNIIEILKGLL